MDEATTVVSAHSAPNSSAANTPPRGQKADPSMPVRSADLEPYTGLGYLSKLFKLMAAVLLLLLLSEIVTGLIAQGTAAIPTLLGEISRLVVLAGLLYGSGDIAYSNRNRPRHRARESSLGGRRLRAGKRDPRIRRACPR